MHRDETVFLEDGGEKMGNFLTINFFHHQATKIKILRYQKIKLIIAESTCWIFSHDPSFAIVFSQQVLLNSIFWG